MNINRDDWQSASGTFVQDTHGQLWRIIGFIDRPAVILDPVDLGPEDTRQRETVIMGTEHSSRFARLKLENAA